MPHRDQRDYFVIFPPVPLLYVYAQQSIVNERVAQISIDTLVNGSVLAENFARMRHNVHVAELELVMWCVRRGLTFTHLLDEDLLADYYSNEYDFQGGATQRIMTYIHTFAQQIGAGLDMDDDAIMHDRTVEELCKVTPMHHRRDAKPHFPIPKFWNSSNMDEYFDVYPVEEVRIPIMCAIYCLRAVGGLFWTERAEELYGKEMDLRRRKNKSTRPNWQRGETWEQTLLKDDDDVEPWMQ